MSAHRIPQVFTCLLALSALPGAARADIYDTYNPANPGNTFPSVLTAFSDTSGQNIWGVEFTPTQSGILNSLTAAIAVENVVPNVNAGATFQFNLFAQTLGGPVTDPFNDTPIDTFSQFVTTPNNTITNITFASTDHPFMSTSDTYWLFMGTSPGEEQPLDWGVPGSGGVIGTVNDASTSFGSFVTSNSISTQTDAAFVLNGQPGSVTPEPDLRMLTGLAFIVLVAVRLGIRRSAGAR
jgi:hypothetical protein